MDKGYGTRQRRFPPGRGAAGPHGSLAAAAGRRGRFPPPDAGGLARVREPWVAVPGPPTVNQSQKKVRVVVQYRYSTTKEPRKHVHRRT